MSDADQRRQIVLTAGIVSGYLGRNSVSPADLPVLISTIYQALRGLEEPTGLPDVQVELKPAVPIKKSITADYLICLEDGKMLKTLKRHLANSYNLTPAEYRAKWCLPSDYPMVAPNYAKVRSEMALKIGLGQSRKK